MISKQVFGFICKSYIFYGFFQASRKLENSDLKFEEKERTTNHGWISLKARRTSQANS